jgi:hypothetical protein
MKKGLIATFMVALILITVLSSNSLVEAIKISKERNEFNGTSHHFEFEISTEMLESLPNNFNYIPFAKVTIHIEDEEENRVIQTDILGSYWLVIPENKDVTLINAEHLIFKYHSHEWIYLKWVTLAIYMVPRFPRTIDYPFLQHFPLLNLLLQRLRI